MSNFMKIQSVGAWLFQRIDTMKLIVAFHNFAGSPKNVLWW